MKGLLLLGMLCLFAIPFAAGQESDQIGFPQLNLPIKLHVNESAFLESESLQITLNHIEDSRCPSDVTCIWAGEAKAQLSLIHNEQMGNLTLSTMAYNKPVSFDGYLISLIKMDPYPTSTKNITSADYIATILVSKEEGLLSPKQQMTNGVLPQDVVCHDGLALVQKASTDTAVCVKPETAKILAERTWGTILKEANLETENPKQVPNPASTYCFDNGGKIEMSQTDAGVEGICVFSDGSKCEEWQYYRGECKPESSNTPIQSSLEITTEKDQYAIGEPINFTITNSGSARLFPIGWGYSITGPNGEQYAPSGVLKMMLIALSPGNSTNWEWNQLDGNNTQVGPGQYSINASYSEENTEKEITNSKLVEITSQ
ncbi:MAG: DUF333 domain-containing protein [Candidatus Nitrosotenuis sp.]|nr:MAG: DUF333 domain-containing protein [Candidatus Nitrosotenuis sp.]